MTDMYHVPGAYVSIFGYERSAIYPFGHRNVFFAKRADSAGHALSHARRAPPDYALPLGPMGDEPAPRTGDLVANDTRLLYEEVGARTTAS